MNAAPAYKTAAMNTKRTGSPHGILITTTPGSQYKNTVNYNSGNMYYVYLYNKYITALWLIFFELLEHAKALIPILVSKDRNKLEID